MATDPTAAGPEGSSERTPEGLSESASPAGHNGVARGSAGPKRVAGKPRERETLKRAATPWGTAVVVGIAKVAQRAGEKRFATVVELLESERGEELVRIAYSTDGVVRRGPVTLRVRDLERLRAAVAKEGRLADVLDRLGGDA